MFRSLTHHAGENTSDSGWRIINVWRQLANLDQTHSKIFVIMLEEKIKEMTKAKIMNLSLFFCALLKT